MDKISTYFYFLDNRNEDLNLVIEADKLVGNVFSDSTDNDLIVIGFECVTNFLDTLHLEPSKESVDKILQYSKDLDSK